MPGPAVEGRRSFAGRPRAGHARPLHGGGIVLKRLVGSGLDRSGNVTGDGNRTRRHICIPRNYAAAAQRRGGVKTPPYSTDDLRQPIITPAAYIFLSIPTKYEQNKCPAAFWGSRAVLYIIGNTAQFPPYGLSTAPADLRAKSRRKRRLRSEAPRCGSVCGTASALPKCSIIHKVLSALLA